MRRDSKLRIKNSGGRRTKSKNYLLKSLKRTSICRKPIEVYQIFAVG
jgi:hypothetical protein